MPIKIFRTVQKSQGTNSRSLVADQYPEDECLRCGYPSELQREIAEEEGISPLSAALLDKLGYYWCERHEYMGKLLEWAQRHDWPMLDTTLEYRSAVGPGAGDWLTFVGVGNEEAVGEVAVFVDRME